MKTDEEHTSFWPPHCPNPGCEQANSARRGGFFRHGHYRTQVHGRRIPRFLCRSCRRTMSSQTFDETYRLRMPELEQAILDEISRGSSLRRVAEVLQINRKTVSRRLRRARVAAAHAAEAQTVAAVAEPEAPPPDAFRPRARSGRSRGQVV
jgi:transposase-like protein